jgi:hypothetical protein
MYRNVSVGNLYTNFLCILILFCRKHQVYFFRKTFDLSIHDIHLLEIMQILYQKSKKNKSYLLLFKPTVSTVYKYRELQMSIEYCVLKYR